MWWNSGSNLARLGRDGVTRALDLLAGLVHALVSGACSLGGGVAGGPKTVFLPRSQQVFTLRAMKRKLLRLTIGARLRQSMADIYMAVATALTESP